MAANNGKLKMTFHNIFFNVNSGNAIKIFDARGLKVMRAVTEKHINNCFLPYWGKIRHTIMTERQIHS